MLDDFWLSGPFVCTAALAQNAFPPTGRPGPQQSPALPLPGAALGFARAQPGHVSAGARCQALGLPSFWWIAYCESRFCRGKAVVFAHSSLTHTCVSLSAMSSYLTTGWAWIWWTTYRISSDKVLIMSVMSSHQIEAHSGSSYNEWTAKPILICSNVI